MPHQHYTMTSTDIYRYAATWLQQQLQWCDHGPKTTVSVLFQILFYAAGQVCSIFAACGRLRDAPSDQAVRDALNALCPDCECLERQFNASFAQQVPKGLKKRPQRLAIDLTLLPYYGKPDSQAEEIYRGQAKNGTTHFHAYATAYVVYKGQRYTVALIYVEQGTSMVTVLKQLLETARRAGVRPSLLLLDRGFYNVEAIRYLQSIRCPFLMPVVRRGLKPSHPRGPSGTYAFADRKCSGWEHYTLTDANGQEATVRICIHCRNWSGRRLRHGRKALVYAFWGFNPKTTQWVYRTYRLRFGIETSYRQLNEARIKTTMRSPALRLLFVGIALVLRNVWVWVHWHRLASPRLGGRKLNLHKLRFKTLLIWLAHLAEQTFGINDSVVVERPG